MRKYKCITYFSDLCLPCHLCHSNKSASLFSQNLALLVFFCCTFLHFLHLFFFSTPLLHFFVLIFCIYIFPFFLHPFCIFSTLLHLFYIFRIFPTFLLSLYLFYTFSISTTSLSHISSVLISHFLCISPHLFLRCSKSFAPLPYHSYTSFAFLHLFTSFLHIFRNSSA